MDANLPEQIGRAAARAVISRQQHDDDVATRNRYIREADRAGATLTEIHKWSGLSISHVSRICAGQN
ncbi:MAG TPA: hypothetical protein VHA75_01075 [Rugosimonospora sp.]|nr:hypothetical protein [Rugosimonospora sp.]